MYKIENRKNKALADYNEKVSPSLWRLKQTCDINRFTEEVKIIQKISKTKQCSTKNLGWNF